MSPPANYALSGVRKTQFFIAAVSLPCAIAAVIDKNGSAETIVQLIWLIISMCASLVFLFIRRKGTTQQYPVYEILGDLSLLVLFVGAWIAGIVILSVKEVNHWRATYAQGIPHIYTNLSCLIMWLSYAYTFFISIHRRCLVQLSKAQYWRSWGTTFVQCPSCDRSASALMGSNARWEDSSERGANSLDNTPGLYTDDEAEAQTLLRGETHEVTKQETGTIKLTDETV